MNTLALFDISNISASSQIEIPLAPTDLNYESDGVNFITSFIINDNFTVPLYSCSTTNIYLNDFEYFQFDVAQSGPVTGTGTSSVREFEGEFTPYGFFEEEASVFRGPAGVARELKTDEVLNSGLYSILY